jgi:hypothetical protein
VYGLATKSELEAKASAVERASLSCGPCGEMEGHGYVAELVDTSTPTAAHELLDEGSMAIRPAPLMLSLSKTRSSELLRTEAIPDTVVSCIPKPDDSRTQDTATVRMVSENASAGVSADAQRPKSYQPPDTDRA